METNRYFEYVGVSDAPVSHEAFVAACDRFEQVRAWCESTQPVVVERDWWRAVATPSYPDRAAADRGVLVEPKWEVSAGEVTDRHGNPYPLENWHGSYVGFVHGEARPTEEQLVSMVSEWQENCE